MKSSISTLNRISLNSVLCLVILGYLPVYKIYKSQQTHFVSVTGEIRHSMYYVIFSFPFLDLLSRIDLDELMKKDEPPLEFPDTLEGFEYIFNESK